MSPKPTQNQLQDARVFVDRIANLTAKSGHGVPLRGKRYDRAVKQAARMAAKVRPSK